MMPIKTRFFALVLVLALGGLAGCAPREKTPLVVFCAGSLIQPVDDLEKAFENKYPSIDVQNECHGSIQVIRHVTELHQKIDVVATADQALIPILMYTTQDPDSGKPYADWYIRFATNRLALAYSDQSRYADEITPDNWMEILTRPDVRVGIADPRFDAAGYRALMVFKLAENVYSLPDLFERMFADAFRYPLAVSENDGRALIRVPEVMETKSDAHILLRGASIQLIALLESGDLDYAFEYESVIRQHGLRIVNLPDSLNLGSADQEAAYGRVAVKLDFQRFATVRPEFKGEQIGYGITIPSNAPHPQEAAQYIAFLLGPEGRQIMEQNDHPLLSPLRVDGYENLPQALRSLVTSAP